MHPIAKDRVWCLARMGTPESILVARVNNMHFKLLQGPRTAMTVTGTRQGKEYASTYIPQPE